MKLQIFLGGSLELLHGKDDEQGKNKGYRPQVVDQVISQLNARKHAKHVYIVKDYTDLTHNVLKEKHQDVYTNYIKKRRPYSVVYT